MTIEARGATRAEERLRAYRESLPEHQRDFLRPPVFESVEAERRHRKERLAGTFRLFARFGFGDGVAGHITARDPEFPDQLWVNPLAMHFSQIRVSDLLLVDHRGDVIEGRFPVNPAAFALHAEVHRARPEVVAVAHAHSVHGMAWSTLGRLLEPITQDACAFYGDHAVFDAYDGSPVSPEDGRMVAQALGSSKAVILRNHGLITVGETIEACAWWFISMERCCRVQLLAEAAGEPRLIRNDIALATRCIQGNPGIGWFNFLPMWDVISREQPDLFD